MYDTELGGPGGCLNVALGPGGLIVCCAISVGVSITREELHEVVTVARDLLSAPIIDRFRSIIMLSELKLACADNGSGSGLWSDGLNPFVWP
jgi:hypothetical protein